MEQLKALDESIKRWKKILFGSDVDFLKEAKKDCPLCEYIYKEQGHKSCCDCIISQVTNDEKCKNTNYRKTSVSFLQFILREQRVRNQDNKMLSELYEIRREYIARYHKGELK